MAARRSKAANARKSAHKYTDILYEVKDQVAWVTINRPRVLNSFREQTLDEMIHALKSTREDPTIVCAVVTGAGTKSFSAGGDFFAMKRLNFTNAYMWNDRMLGLAMTIRGLPIPVIAMVNGWCMGGGHELALVVRRGDRVAKTRCSARPARKSARARPWARRNTCRSFSASGSRAK